MKVLSLTLLILVLVICSFSFWESADSQFCLGLFFYVYVCLSLCVINLTTVSQVILKQLLKRVGWWGGDSTWYILVVLHRLTGKTQIINLLSNNFHWKSGAVFRMYFTWCTLVLQRLWVVMWQWEKLSLRDSFLLLTEWHVISFPMETKAMRTMVVCHLFVMYISSFLASHGAFTSIGGRETEIP